MEEKVGTDAMQCNIMYQQVALFARCFFLTPTPPPVTQASGSVQMQTIDLCNIKLHLMRERALAMARQSISVPRTY
jgi:hypothetical protein